VIQRNFPAPAWLDLKTFAPQPTKELRSRGHSSFAGARQNLLRDHPLPIMDLKTMAPTSWNENGPLLAGPVRAYQDNVAAQIVIETTKFHPAGSGLEICRLEFGRAREARAILALADLLRGGSRSCRWGRSWRRQTPTIR
jgi:hypothetical protein